MSRKPIPWRKFELKDLEAVTRVGFEESALKFAIANRIGLAVLKKEWRAITHFDARAATHEREFVACEHALLTSGKHFGTTDDWSLDMVVQVEMRRLGWIPGSRSSAPERRRQSARPDRS